MLQDRANILIFIFSYSEKGFLEISILIKGGVEKAKGGAKPDFLGDKKVKIRGLAFQKGATFLTN